MERIINHAAIFGIGIGMTYRLFVRWRVRWLNLSWKEMMVHLSDEWEHFKWETSFTCGQGEPINEEGPLRSSNQRGGDYSTWRKDQATADSSRKDEPLVLATTGIMMVTRVPSEILSPSKNEQQHKSHLEPMMVRTRPCLGNRKQEAISFRSL